MLFLVNFCLFLLLWNADISELLHFTCLCSCVCSIPVFSKNDVRLFAPCLHLFADSTPFALLILVSFNFLCILLQTDPFIIKMRPKLYSHIIKSRLQLYASNFSTSSFMKSFILFFASITCSDASFKPVLEIIKVFFVNFKNVALQWKHVFSSLSLLNLQGSHGSTSCILSMLLTAMLSASRSFCCWQHSGQGKTTHPKIYFKF